MRRLPRRLALWGGAAAIAGGGFAFMNGITVGASSAGEGVGAVTGYTASAVSYTYTSPFTNLSSPYCFKWTANTSKYGCFVTFVKFHLKANSPTASAQGKPTSLTVQLLHTNAPLGHTARLATMTTFSPKQWYGHSNVCVINTWTSGQGTVTCQVSGPSKGSPYYINEGTVTGLDVEANQ